MMRPDDFEYALENTRLLLNPRSTIDTFGTSLFQFHLITESMDRVNETRLRKGNIQAERPAILSPHHFRKLLLEGFGEQAEAFLEQQEDALQHHKILRYGFRIRKSDVSEEIHHEPVETVIARAFEAVSDNPRQAIIHGVEVGWEVGLLKCTVDLIERSVEGNASDLFGA